MDGTTLSSHYVSVFSHGVVTLTEAAPELEVSSNVFLRDQKTVGNHMRKLGVPKKRKEKKRVTALHHKIAPTVP